MNLNIGPVLAGARLMPEIVADLPSLTYHHLFPRPRILEAQLGPDLFLVRARRQRAGVRNVERPIYGRRLQPTRESAADLLQIAQTVKGGSIHDCNCAAKLRLR